VLNAWLPLSDPSMRRLDADREEKHEPERGKHEVKQEKK
jgi:hypothetical protein